MSHDTSTGHIYIGGTAQNPVGISLADIDAILSCGLDLGSACRSGNIQRWAKNKPVRSQIVGSLSASDRQAAMWGLHEPTTNTGTVSNYKQKLIDAAGDTSAYVYDHPRGIAGTTLNPYSTNEWFRALDFNDYYHTANQPLQSFTMPSFNVPEMDSTFNITLVRNTQNTGSISLADIVSKLGLTNWYVAIGFVKPDNTFFWRTSTRTIGDWANNNPVTLDVAFNKTDAPWSNIATGVSGVTENYYIAACNVQSSNIDDDPTFRALPFNITSEGCGTLTVTNIMPVSFTILKVYSGASFPSGTFNGIGTNLGTSYYTLFRQGNFAIGVKIQNSTSRGISLSLTGSNGLEFGSDINAITYESPKTATGAHTPTVYYASSQTATLTQASDALYVGAGATVYAYLYVSQFYKYPNPGSYSTINEGQGTSRITIYYDGTNRWDQQTVKIQFYD